MLSTPPPDFDVFDHLFNVQNKPIGEITDEDIDLLGFPIYSSFARHGKSKLVAYLWGVHRPMHVNLEIDTQKTSSGPQDTPPDLRRLFLLCLVHSSTITCGS
jgi:hypothetical protein